MCMFLSVAVFIREQQETKQQNKIYSQAKTKNLRKENNLSLVSFTSQHCQSLSQSENFIKS